ncbi:succinate dehydrogenase assembly factor 2 [Maricaulis sp.]|uniref:FAD assembly factor SdhE n=1 Tax=Maricaulis sp. TaxID=1486257 RepID=UPI003A8EA87E
MTETLENRRKKLRIRAWRRGFKEADLILGRYADQMLEAMSETDIADFDRLLDQLDADIYSWVIGTAPTPSEFDTPVMDNLKTFRVDRDAAFGDGPKT